MSISSVHAAAFYREVAASGVVWGIEDTGGFPAPRGSGGSRAMPFWSSQSRALSVVSNVPAYYGFEPVAIEWEVFCERWIPGLSRDGLLVGVNWSGKTAKGFDITPAQVKLNIEALSRT
ncbi:hypothetical protein GCE9029_01209 [Grimontia celer]|uniref:DUF2750 domain-containing protein n=1 Tax=Grimontia celer TaxID=1796497 RepID=A0A128EWQ1_9GAMM|nr:hypothetical protein GCE9029_01209 [Grimontia celer]